MPSSMTRYIYAGLFLVGLIAIVYAWSAAAGGVQSGIALAKHQTGELSGLDFETAGNSAPEDAFLDPEGEATAFSAFEGKTILVNFWATWCGPCERELPSLGALQPARGSDGFEVIAVSVDGEADADYARERLAELTGGTLSFFHAPDYKPVYGAGVRGFPTTILYGPDGSEIARLAGEADWANYEAIAFIDDALAMAASQ